MRANQHKVVTTANPNVPFTPLYPHRFPGTALKTTNIGTSSNASLKTAGTGNSLVITRISMISRLLFSRSSPKRLTPKEERESYLTCQVQSLTSQTRYRTGDARASTIMSRSFWPCHRTSRNASLSGSSLRPGRVTMNWILGQQEKTIACQARPSNPRCRTACHGQHRDNHHAGKSTVPLPVDLGLWDRPSIVVTTIVASLPSQA